MALVSVFESKFLTRQFDFGPSNLFRTDFIQKQIYTPSVKLKGAWITLPNGTKFRKATSHLRYSRWLEPGSAERTTGFRNGKPTIITSSPGGYESDFILKSNFPTIRSAIGSVTKFSNPPITIPAEMRNEAATKALLKIASQKAAIGENLATFRQTLDLIHRPGWRLVNALRDGWKDQRFRNLLESSARDIRRRKDIPLGISEAYLQYVYGLRPLMQDVHGVMELLGKEGSKDLLLAGHGSSSQQCEFRIGDYSSLISKTSIPTGEEKARVSCKIWGRIDPNSAGMRTLNQLGLVNPLSLAWELVPWSFVIDWFVPIGSVLQALTAPAGLIFVDGSTSLRFGLTAPYTNYNWGTGLTYFQQDSQPSTGTARYEGYYRVTLGSWPLPGVWANSNPFAGDRPLKALALAITQLRVLR